MPTVRYGTIPPGRIDIRSARCLSLDLRSETGVYTADETAILDPPHPFTLSVFGEVGDGLPLVGEIRFAVHGREVRLVGHMTGRQGVYEVTPDHLFAAMSDSDYRKQLVQWIGFAA